MKMKILTLGPKYSYSYIATKTLFPKAEIEFTSEIKEIYKKVKSNEFDLGVSPFENMIEGQVREALNSLIKYDLKIYKAMNLKIKHCLASQNNSFQEIVSHPQAIGQCSDFLEEYKNKGIKIKNTQSTSKAMQLASENKETAAIGSIEAAQNYNLNILNKNIGNNKENITRFIIISNQENKQESQNTRTSLILIPEKDTPGLLFKILKPLAEEKINLTRIESIPSGDKIGKYNFYIELSGSYFNSSIKKAINEIKDLVKIKFLGSYPLTK